MISVLVVSLIVIGGTALVLTLALLFAEDGYEDAAGFHFEKAPRFNRPPNAGRLRASTGPRYGRLSKGSP
jgi:hypothetical protein